MNDAVGSPPIPGFLDVLCRTTVFCRLSKRQNPSACEFQRIADISPELFLALGFRYFAPEVNGDWRAGCVVGSTDRGSVGQSSWRRWTACDWHLSSVRPR